MRNLATFFRPHHTLPLACQATLLPPHACTRCSWRPGDGIEEGLGTCVPAPCSVQPCVERIASMSDRFKDTTRAAEGPGSALLIISGSRAIPPYIVSGVRRYSTVRQDTAPEHNNRLHDPSACGLGCVAGTDAGGALSAAAGVFLPPTIDQHCHREFSIARISYLPDPCT